jgi:hypothetical protein
VAHSKVILAPQLSVIFLWPFRKLVWPTLTTNGLETAIFIVAAVSRSGPKLAGTYELRPAVKKAYQLRPELSAPPDKAMYQLRPEL